MEEGRRKFELTLLVNQLHKHIGSHGKNVEKFLIFLF
jgi:hypothetical protein